MINTGVDDHLWKGLIEGVIQGLMILFGKVQ
jgi:hypothetical protein